MQTRVVAKVLLSHSDGTVLLLRRSDSDLRRPNEFDIPGGHTDGTEYANEAAARETKEEAGIDVQPRELSLVYSESKVVDGNLNVIWLLFVGRTDEKNVAISNEHKEYRWVTLDEAIELLEYDRQKRMLTFVRDNQLS